MQVQGIKMEAQVIIMWQVEVQELKTIHKQDLKVVVVLVVVVVILPQGVQQQPVQVQVVEEVQVLVQQVDQELLE